MAIAVLPVLAANGATSGFDRPALPIESLGCHTQDPIGKTGMQLDGSGIFLACPQSNEQRQQMLFSGMILS